MGWLVELHVAKGGQVGQFDVFDLLLQIGNVHLLDRRHGLGRRAANARLALLHLVHLVDTGHYLGHVGLEDHAAHAELLKNVLDLVEVEDEIELAHVLEAFVQRLHEHLDEVEDAELALAGVDAKDKVESGVVSVDELEVGAADEAENKKMDNT